MPPRAKSGAAVRAQSADTAGARAPSAAAAAPRVKAAVAPAPLRNGGPDAIDAAAPPAGSTLVVALFDLAATDRTLDAAFADINAGWAAIREPIARATQNSHRLKLNMLPPGNFRNKFGFRLAYEFPGTAFPGSGEAQEAFQLEGFAGAKFQWKGCDSALMRSAPR